MNNGISEESKSFPSKVKIIIFLVVGRANKNGTISVSVSVKSENLSELQHSILFNQFFIYFVLLQANRLTGFD